MSERGTHVPLIVDWPRYRSTYKTFGNCCGDLIDFSDFFATAADLAETDLPADRVIDGISFASRLRNGKAGTREFIFCHYWGFGRKQQEKQESVRDVRWKLYDDGRFYDLITDIEETSPISTFDAEANQAKHRLEKVFEKVRLTK